MQSRHLLLFRVVPQGRIVFDLADVRVITTHLQLSSAVTARYSRDGPFHPELMLIEARLFATRAYFALRRCFLVDYQVLTRQQLRTVVNFVELSQLCNAHAKCKCDRRQCIEGLDHIVRHIRRQICVVRS